MFQWAGLAQEVQGLSTCLDGPGIESLWRRDFLIPEDWPCGPPSQLNSDHTSHINQRLNKEYSDNSTPHLRLRSLLQCALPLHLVIRFYAPCYVHYGNDSIVFH
jgi:hypothetical protein